MKKKPINDPLRNRGFIPRTYAEALTADIFVDYLTRTGWKRQPDPEPNEVALFRAPKRKKAAVRFCLTHKYADYLNVFVESLFTVAAIEQRPYWEVYMDMAGRYYVAPHTYSTGPLAVPGPTNGAVKHESTTTPVA
jgi:hypothetical protein